MPKFLTWTSHVLCLNGITFLIFISFQGFPAFAWFSLHYLTKQCDWIPPFIPILDIFPFLPLLPILINGWSQNQKFGALHGCLVGKYKAFGEKVSALAWKNPKSFRARFENTRGYPVWNFFVVDLKKKKKNMDLLISKLLSKSILDFGKWWNWKYANM